MKIVISAIVLLLFFAGCSVSKVQNNGSHIDKMEKSEKVYKSINKDDLLHAFKKVFILANSEKFVIDSYRDGLNITRVNEVYKFVTIQIETDNYEFKINKEDNGDIKVKLLISRGFGADNDNKEYLNKDNSVYKLLWNRADYLLGLNKTWESCMNFGVSNSFLCESSVNVTQKDIINLQNKTNKLNLKSNKKEEEIIKKKLVRVELNKSEDEGDFINYINDGIVPPENNSIIIVKSEDYDLQANEIINVE